MRPLPPGTIGNTFSVSSVMKSMNTRRSLSLMASLQGAFDVTRLLDLHADVAIGLGEFDEIGQRIHVALGIAVAVEELLPLPHHAERAVVQVDDLHRDVIPLAGGKLLNASARCPRR